MTHTTTTVETATRAAFVCAACGGSTEDETRCGACGASPLLDGRYRLREAIGKGGGGVTYAAERAANGALVCVKELLVHRVESVEALERFEREAAALRKIHHPQVPAYLDHFVVDEGKHVGMYLVQEFVDGQDLTHEIGALNDAQILEVMDELLAVLAALHGQGPPIVHRDIKPSNVMRRSEADGGGLVLVDFGSVKFGISTGMSARMSIAGTYGYMAPELFAGHASPAADVYGVGALAVALRTGREVDELVDASHELQWRKHVPDDSPLREILGQFLAVDPKDRPVDAEAARAVLAGAVRGYEPPMPEAMPEANMAVHEPERAGGKESPLETPNPARAGQPSAGLLGAAILVAFLLLLMLFVPRAENQKVESVDAVEIVESPPDVCTKDCRPISEPFKSGLKFGMSLEAARKARTEVAEGTLWEPDPLGIYESQAGLSPKAEVLSTRMAVAGELSACQLAFDPGLVKLECKGQGAQLPVIDALAYVYGASTGTVEQDSKVSRWGDGLLTVETSRYSDTFTIVHWSKDAYARKAADDAKAKLVKAEARKELEAERKRLEKELKIRELSKDEPL